VHIGLEFDQGLFMSRVSKPTHIHFERKIPEIVPTFHQNLEGHQAYHPKTVLPHGAYHHTQCHDQSGHAIQQTVTTFKMVKHFSLTPPLLMIIGV